MSYAIDACLEEGRPCLRILDAESSAVRLVWHCPVHDAESQTARAVHDLFRELFLLSLLREHDGAITLESLSPADTCSR